MKYSKITALLCLSLFFISCRNRKPDLTGIFFIGDVLRTQHYEVIVDSFIVQNKFTAENTDDTIIAKIGEEIGKLYLTYKNISHNPLIPSQGYLFVLDKNRTTKNDIKALTPESEYGTIVDSIEPGQIKKVNYVFRIRKFTKGQIHWQPETEDFKQMVLLKI